MTQELLHLMAPEDQLTELATRLGSLGFEVKPSGRLSGGVHVRVRKETDDELVVQSAVDAVAPDARSGPSGSPTHNIVGYRE